MGTSGLHCFCSRVELGKGEVPKSAAQFRCAYNWYLKREKRFENVNFKRRLCRWVQIILLYDLFLSFNILLHVYDYSLKYFATRLMIFSNSLKQEVTSFQFFYNICITTRKSISLHIWLCLARVWNKQVTNLPVTCCADQVNECLSAESWYK